MSKKAALIISLTLITLAGIGLVVAIQEIPRYAHEKFQEEMRGLGFANLTLPEPEKRLSAVRYSNVEMDKEGRSVIGTMTVHYGVFDILFDKALKRVDIENLYLSGDMDASGALKISGWTNPAAIIKLHHAEIKNINLKNMTLSILSAQLGGIRIATNIQIINETGEMSWTGNLQSAQNQLEMVAKITGAMQNDAQWQSDIEIENAKIERDIGKITRMSGLMSFYGKDTNVSKISSDLKAGGMTLMDLPWQNVSIALNGSPEQLNTFISAESIGINGVELGFEGLLKDQNFAWNARLFAPEIKTAFEFLNLQKQFRIPKTLLDDIKTQNEIELEFLRREDSFMLSIKDAQSTQTLKTFLLEQKEEL